MSTELKQLAEQQGYLIRGMTDVNSNGVSDGVVLYPADKNSRRICIGFPNKEQAMTWLTNKH